jgi:hypothetical protein
MTESALIESMYTASSSSGHDARRMKQLVDDGTVALQATLRPAHVLRTATARGTSVMTASIGVG